jgi:hypothetical protein
MMHSNPRLDLIPPGLILGAGLIFPASIAGFGLRIIFHPARRAEFHPTKTEYHWTSPPQKMKFVDPGLLASLVEST